MLFILPKIWSKRQVLFKMLVLFLLRIIKEREGLKYLYNPFSENYRVWEPVQPPFSLQAMVVN